MTYVVETVLIIILVIIEVLEIVIVIVALVFESLAGEVVHGAGNDLEATVRK